MSFAAPKPVQLPQPLQGYYPATFRERGLAIPFTTPQLAGARVRPGERAPLEMLVPNPAGGRGIYIIAATDIHGLCRPTLHDLRLIELIGARNAVSPGGIRAIALEVAEDGLAGRSAIAAAQECRANLARGLLETNFEMLLALLKQVDPQFARAFGGAQSSAAIEARAKAAIAAIAPELGMAAREVAQLLEDLAVLFLPIGIGTTRGNAPIPRIVAALGELRQEAAQWWQTQPDDGGPEAGMLAMTAELTLTCVRQTLTEAYALTSELRTLLRRRLAEPETVAELVARPEWLTDGWERIIALWRTARAGVNRRDIMAEIVTMLPVIPKEAGEWMNVGLGMQEELMRHRRKIVLYEDWRTGASLLDVMERNEHLLTHSVWYGQAPPVGSQ